MENAFEMAQTLGFEKYELRKEITGIKSVEIKCLPIRKFPEYAQILEDECACVELFTGLTPTEVDTLHRDDFVHILERGHALNLNPFSDWLKRRKAMSAKAEAIWNSSAKKKSNQDGESSAEKSQE